MTRHAGIEVKDAFFIGGSWVPATGRSAIPVIDPSTELQIASVPAGTEQDIGRAVSAARVAFGAWAATGLPERARLLAAAADALEKRVDEIAAVISAEMGAPFAFSKLVQVRFPVKVMRFYANVLSTYTFEEQIDNSLVIREPIGVVGAITPWNYPLHQVVAKVAAALAAGCTVVLKPSEAAPLSAYLLAEVFEQVGLPAGVFNMVTGVGPVVGEALAIHPDVDMVTFTGSTMAGRRVMAAASATVKRVALELGGKSAFVILDDADLGQAVEVGLANCFVNSGQTCTAWSRMLVPVSKYDEVIELARTVAKTYTVGDPHDPATRIGPIANASQYKRVLDHISTAVNDGARVVAGGIDRPDGLSKGFYVRPTVLADVKPGSAIEQEEVFGPVLAVIAYLDEDDAVAIANDTPYGLAGGVFSGDQDRALRIARQMHTGMVHVNGGRFNLVAPFGGYKQSGNGRELGTYGLEEFLEIKSLQL